MKKFFVLAIVVMVALSACGSPAPAPTAVPPTAVPPTATEIPPTAVPPTATEIPPTATPQPTATVEPCSDPTQKTFESINNSSEVVTWYWLNPTTKNLDLYQTVNPGERFVICRYIGHKWVVRNAKGDVVFQYAVTYEDVQRKDVP